MDLIQKLKIGLLAFSIALFSNAAIAKHHVGPSNCESPDTALFMYLTSDETWRASMALGYAAKNLDFGPVTIFLSIEGTRIGVKEDKLPHDVYGLNGKTTLESLEEFLDKGGKALVCPGCLTRAGFKEKDLIKHPNLSMGNAEAVRDELECSLKQASF